MEQSRRTRPAAADNLPAPFHVYSMRQAIEEGFILDVLQNYTTYKTTPAMAAIKRFSIDTLIAMLAQAGVGVTVKVRRGKHAA